MNIEKQRKNKKKLKNSVNLYALVGTHVLILWRVTSKTLVEGTVIAQTLSL